jgi:hypothetical protein
MKELYDYAKAHASKQVNFTGSVELDEGQVRGYAKDDFIAGATSKWVEIEKISYALDILNRAKDLDILTVYHNLKEDLNQLQDEARN